MTAAKNAERHTAAQEAQDAIVIKILTAYGDNGPFINGELQSLHPPVKEHLLPLYSGSSSPKMYTAEQVDAVVNVLLNGAKE